MGRGDLHLHSSRNDGTASVREILNHVRDHTDLDAVAITDHDRLAGTLEAMDLAANYPFDVVPGVEITTLAGHLLALWVIRPIPMWRGLEWTLMRIHEQGGVAVVPHPMSPLTRSVGQSAIERVLRRQDRDGAHIDAIELFNPSVAGQVTAAKARRLNQERYGFPESGGSDSHDLRTVGTAYTTYPGRGQEAYRQALLAGQTRAGGEAWGFGEHRHTAYLKLRKSLSRLGVAVPDQTLEFRSDASAIAEPESAPVEETRR